jgi:biotin operon repressor
MKASIVLAVLGLLASAGMAADGPLAWPQFRGPNGSGVADGQKPPVELGVDKNVTWKVPVPSGLSSPIVAGDKLVITAFDEGKLYTIAYRRSDGKEAWRAEAPARQLESYHKTEGSPASSTSATDGERIVSYFGSCGLFGYDLSGQQLWKMELPPAVMTGEFGSGVSPIIVDGTVVRVRDQMTDPKIIALDAATGSVKWETKRLSRASYCTPIVWDTPAGKEIVAAGHARMIGYELKTGAEKWSFSDVPSACCSSPVIADGLLFFAGGSTGPEDKEMQIPPFDAMLKVLDTDKDGVISRAEGEKAFEGFFDNQDPNKDGKITRDEWDAIIKFFSEGKNAAFALKPGGAGDVTESHVIWKTAKGLPYIPSALAYRRPLRDGERRRDRHGLQRQDRRGGFPGARRRVRQPLRLAGRRERTYLLHLPRWRRRDGDQSRDRQAGSCGQEREAGRARRSHAGHRRPCPVHPDRQTSLRFCRENEEMNRVDRLMAIVVRLQSRRVVRAEDLAAHFEISVRTVYRDLAALGEAGIPIVAEAGVGYSLVKGYHLPPVMFTADEASALSIARKLVEHLTDASLRKQMESALAKIRSVLPRERQD